MKKEIYTSVLAFVFVGILSTTSAQAASIDDVVREIASLRKDIATLRSSLKAQALDVFVKEDSGSTSDIKPILEPLPPVPAPSPSLTPSSAQTTVKVEPQTQLPPAPQPKSDIPVVVTNSQGSTNAPFVKTLSFGTKNDQDVVRLQQYLKEKGYFSGPVNGNFGGMTLDAVKKFQKENGLPATGVVGQKTRDMLLKPVEKESSQVLPPLGNPREQVSMADYKKQISDAIASYQSVLADLNNFKSGVPVSQTAFAGRAAGGDRGKLLSVWCQNTGLGGSILWGEYESEPGVFYTVRFFSLPNCPMPPAVSSPVVQN